MVAEDTLEAEAVPNVLEVPGHQLVMDNAVAEGQKGGEPRGSETLQSGVEAVVMVMMLGELLVLAQLPRRAEGDAGLTLGDGSGGQGPQGGRREASGNLIEPKKELVWRRLER